MASGSGQGASPTRSTSTCRCSRSSTGQSKNGTAVDLSAWRPEDAKNSFANTTVDSIVLEVSHQHPQLRPGARIGVWCATKLATDAGGWRQINRAGHPMMWPIFWPDDTDFTNPANTRHPSEDFDAEGTYIASTSPPSSRPAVPQTTPRATARLSPGELFPDVLPYVVGTPATYGFADSQRPDAGRQRTRSNAVPGRRHRCALRAETVRRQAPSGTTSSRTSCQRDPVVVRFV